MFRENGIPSGLLKIRERAEGYYLSLSMIIRMVIPKVSFHRLILYILNRFLSSYLPVSPILYPYFMQIEPTTRCDLSCSFCPRKGLPGKGEDLEVDIFRDILEGNPFLSSILLQGLGEPLLNPHLEDIIKYARSRGIFVGTCTNGMNLSKDRIDSLLDCGLNYLAISVDGTGEAFESTRKGASFDRLLKGLTELRKKDDSRCIKAFWMTIRSDNLPQIVSVIDLACEYGINHVHFQDLQYKHAPDILTKLSISSCEDHHEWEAIVSSAIRRALRERIVMTLDPFDRHYRRTHCRWPWDGIYVDCRGDVRPCCVSWGNNGFVMGNIVKESLSSIWRGKRYREFRRDLKHGPLPAVCKECRFL